MGRLLKGGVWTNVEDEVLKAAIMKYGTNQWARVASLLHRKSDKQCKARWYEWLSPTVKKTEWTQEENEKLLHLGKVLPTQWRTISDIIGRTAAQCVQQYSHLIDITRSAKEGVGEFDTLRADDNDLRPESRPAKPDPIDMAEDEIDMLNEARARLANTQGKKAKRKGRERQLIMARRLAAVQQKRELAEVGIIGRSISNKKRAGVNYSEEIPFYQPIPKGFHDTSQEKYEATDSVIGKRVCELEFETREEREKRERKKDIDLKRKKEEENLPGEIHKGMKDNQIKRSKLMLSEPKISEEEMHTILKMSHENDATLHAAVNEGFGSTSHLLGGYMSEREKASTIIPDKTPMASTNRLAMQAENIRSLHYTKTPLLGGNNPELYDLNSVDRNKMQIGETPNTSLRRNLLGIPGDQSNFGTPGGQSNFNTPNLSLGRDGAKFNLGHKKKLVQENLSQIPVPNKDPKSMNEQLKSVDEFIDIGSSVKFGTSGEIMDQDDIDRMKENERKKLEAAMWEKRSQVIKRNLPRPMEINHTILRPPPQQGDPPLTDSQRADELVKLEMIKMMHKDNILNPVEIKATGKYTTMSATERRKLSEQLLAESHKFLELNAFEEYSEEELKSADALLKGEMEMIKKEMGHGDVNEETFSKVWEECKAQVLYFPSEKRYTRANLVSRKDRIESYKHLFDLYTIQYIDMTKKAKKKEDKLTTLFGGYMARSKLLQKAVSDVYDHIERNEIELCSLKKIREQEQRAIANRIEALELDVDRQKIRENQLQMRYAELVKIKEQLMGSKSQ